ncbi:DUF4180 domain-containing protein [Pseudomonas piscis]|uniref:DUF4180 domain-containing protein n=1 Tax=Pseudomonas piscis TaxID=2614538 RepID=UPI0021D5A9F6|nr:DUF4180 domain-containing protein [Pseudomonas piscis]MCU7646892.1 DUF4180 domain-containing protein [Pseudomonas piscis]
MERFERLTLAGQEVLLAAEAGPLLDSEAAALQLIGAAWELGGRWIVWPVERLPQAFFDLQSRLAGSLVQKLLNYGLRFAVLGDIQPWLAHSRALRDLVRETDRGGDWCFVHDLAALERRLRGEPVQRH